MILPTQSRRLRLILCLPRRWYWIKDLNTQVVQVTWQPRILPEWMRIISTFF